MMVESLGLRTVTLSQAAQEGPSSEEEEENMRGVLKAHVPEGHLCGV